jgi:hypothetical protein
MTARCSPINKMSAVTGQIAYAEVAYFPLLGEDGVCAISKKAALHP